MFKKAAIISGIVFSSILLVGCNEEQEVKVIAIIENEGNEGNLSIESNILSELHDEIIASITKQTKLEPTSIMVDGNPLKEMAISVGFSKNVKVDDKVIQQIIKDSIKKVSEKENVTTSEENITIKIEK